jgi:copper transport protein
MRVKQIARRRLVRLLAAFLIAGASLVVPAAVLAHAQVVAVDPPDGARLATPPTQVAVTFNEPVGLGSEGLRVLDASGAEVDDGPDQLQGQVVRQPVRDLSTGWYVIVWDIVSEDGHVVHGSSTFAVGDADPAARPGTGGPDAFTILTGATRAVADLGLLVAAGAWAAWWLLGTRRRPVARLATGAALTAALATAGWAAVQAQEGGSTWTTSWPALLSIIRFAALMTAVAVGARAPRLTAAAATLALLTLALGGHTTTAPVAAVSEAAHLLAAIVWLGAAPAVLVSLRARDLPDAEAMAIVRRFSRLAGYALVGVALAGSLTALLLTEWLAGGLLTPYALIVGAKLALVGIAAGLGALGRRSLGRDPRPSRYRLLFGVDAGLLVGVAIASSLLTLVGPHEGHAGHEGHPGPGSALCITQVAGHTATLLATPGSTGTNQIIVSGVDPASLGARVELGHQLLQDATIEVDLEAGTDAWSGSVALPFDGTWDATLVVRQDTFTEARASCSLTIAP